jgi:hypothetical protein
MTIERAEYIIDHLFDLLSDSLGRSRTLDELKINYSLEFTEEELAWLLRGLPHEESQD